MNHSSIWLSLLRLSFTFALASPCLARDLWVGRDTDAPTIAHAIKIAQPGDVIHLEPNRVYHDYAGFYNKQGAPGKPITLDGHGATLEGSDPLDPTNWQELSPGHFRSIRLSANFNGAMLARWFFLFDDQMQRMGRVSKGHTTALKAPTELESGEWTFEPSSPPAKDHSTPITGAFHLRIAPGQTLPQANIRIPVRSAGVQFSGDNAHLILRNLTTTHPYNDGFNIHGDCRDILFQNIRAIECGDDGISAHESAQYRVHGFISQGNATGICDTGTAQTHYSHVFMSNNVGFDLYFLDEVQASLRHALILSSAQQPLMVVGRNEKTPCHLTMEQVQLHRMTAPFQGKIARHGHLTASQCTIDQMTLETSGTTDLKNCLINNQPSEPGATGADLAPLKKLLPLNP
jgi:hypothetical protein